MKGSTMKRCSCAVEYDAKGRRKACNKRHGSWTYIVDAGRDPKTGKRKQIKKGGFPTQAEANAQMAEVMAAVDQGRFRHDDRQTVKSYLEHWLTTKEGVYRSTTMAAARRHVALVIMLIGHMRLRDLQTSHVSKLYRDIQTPAAPGRGAGVATVRRLHSTFSSALSDARREGLIRTNPASDATLPKDKKPKIDPWTGEELGAFLDHVAGDPLGPLFELMAMTAMRRGTALGLRWSDVNLTDGYIVINQQLHVVESRKGVPEAPCKICGAEHRGRAFGPPKTEVGEGQRIDLGQAAIGVLLTQRLRQDEERMEWGEAYSDHGLVFAEPDGNPLKPNTVTTQFVAQARAAGVRRTRLHDVRHGRASLMLAAGVDIAIVSKTLGHASIRTTSDTYTHLLSGVGTAAAEAADSLIIRRPRTNVPEVDAITQELEDLSRQITLPGADVAGLAARISALHERRASVTSPEPVSLVKRAV